MAHNYHSNSKLLTAQTKIFTAMTNNSQHNQNIHSNNKYLTAQTKMLTKQIKKFTAKANDSQHKPKCSQQKESRTLDLRTPGSLGPLRPRGSPFQNKNLLNANGAIKILRSLYGAQSFRWKRENREDFNMITLQTFDKSGGHTSRNIDSHQ